MQIGLYLAGCIFVAFIVFEITLMVINHLGMSAAVSECRRFIRPFVRAGYAGKKLYFKHKESGREVKLIKSRSPFDWKGELTVELTVLIPSAYRPSQMENICSILKQYDSTAGMTRPGELVAHCPNDEELLSGLIRSILVDGFGLSFGVQLKILQFGPQSVKELEKCDKL